jgi:outer membrane protein assembly factor BamB
MKKCLLSFLILVILSSCNILGCIFPEEKEKTEPEYKSDIVWTLETEMYAYGESLDIVEYDKYLYLIDGEQYSEKNYFNLKKINLETGKILWKTETIYTNVTCAAVKCGTKIFLADEINKYLYVFDDETGKLLATVAFSNNVKINETLSPMVLRNIVTYQNRYLFWGNSKDSEGKIIKFDTNKINFAIDPFTVQIISPELLSKTGSNEDKLRSNLLINENLIFFITQGIDYDNIPVKVGAVDCETGDLKWSYVIQDCYATGGGYNMYYLDGKLYAFIGASICFEAATGKIIYEYVQNIENGVNEVLTSELIYSSGVSYSKGRFYCTTTASSGSSSQTGIDNKYIKNIQCIDAKNGKLIWGDLPEDSSSLGGRPIVLSGKVLVPTYLQGLRVYDEKTGKLIGVDKNIITTGAARNESYKDLLITMQWDINKNTGILTAIRVK